MTLEEWENQPSQIPLWRFLRSIHRFTERVSVHVVIGSEWLEERQNGRHVYDFNLTDNAFVVEGQTMPELDRLLKYYADVPVWNATAQLRNIPYWYTKYKTGPMVAASINVNCHYRDMRDAWHREQDDIRRAKRREYNKKRKAKAQEE